MGKPEIDDINAMAELGLHARLSVWCRADARDLEAAKQCRVDGVQSVTQFRRCNGAASVADRNSTDLVLKLTERARLTSVSFLWRQDASRATRVFLDAFVDAACAAGVDRIRLADTVGLLNPLQTKRLVAHVVARARGVTIGLHAHNDLGMATANTITALAGVPAQPTSR